jgi:DNA-binding winged helix-turn-helix (wHTH) protein
MGSEIISFGSFRLHPLERKLESEGVGVSLGSRAMDILIMLTENAGRVIGRRELMARAWPDLVVEDANLRVHIAALRKALRDGQDGARYVANIPGRGYAFVAPVVRQLGPEPSPEAARTTTPQSAAPAITTTTRGHAEHGLLPLTVGVVGRDALIAEVNRALKAQRLVTLVGAGGIGKTTVAAAVARSQLPSFADGAYFIDLGVLTDAGLVGNTLAAALGFPVQTADPEPVLLTFLQQRATLLILDCCEHLIYSVARLAERIVQETKSVRILATSREPLRIAAEQIHRVEPLACPPQGESLTAAEALGYPAVQLFVARIVATDTISNCARPMRQRWRKSAAAWKVWPSLSRLSPAALEPMACRRLPSC